MTKLQIYCQQDKNSSASCEPINFVQNLAGSNGRSSNSNPEHSTDLHPEGQERVSVILAYRSNNVENMMLYFRGIITMRMPMSMQKRLA